ncbi:hypothetical protein N7468_009181 [Penicillium chermesinum]|uniref:Uncharacterized protein n=1 Tax=Penicillium chermesinum TaxID=63820 RepID=A0A9W9TEL4_9EURO|nr:uncharacterized protein N7468_009181 [Penicillium chermesinum]KAJ5219977.1 hypothetical protein N7468_009181 [Penicillium chermesinum]
MMKPIHDIAGHRPFKAPGPSRRTIARWIDAGDICATTIGTRDNLSHRTFRLRHITQLRRFGACAHVVGVLLLLSALALFSAPDTEVSEGATLGVGTEASPVAGISDILIS